MGGLVQEMQIRLVGKRIIPGLCPDQGILSKMDLVSILTLDGIKSRMCFLTNRMKTMDGDVGGQQLVQAKEEMFGKGRWPVKMGIIAGSVDTGIRAATSDDLDMFAEQRVKVLFDDGLDARPVRLGLPSRIGGSIV